ncbi:hypothetical protein FJW08_13200 [Mesorhizobium sp. B3-2-1]|nr:hypothetical protein FJW08_13200 [Mesorhizobium sp. B3-2-1]
MGMVAMTNSISGTTAACIAGLVKSGPIDPVMVPT